VAEYYGVTRSPEYLAHYGVKGMKWGVRKAREMGGERGAKRLSKEYAKASKKLAKLNAKADINKQNQIAKKYGKIAKVSGSIGAAGIGVSGASKLLKIKNHNDIEKTWANIYNKKYGTNYLSMPSSYDSTRAFVINDKDANKAWQKYFDKNTRLRDSHIVSGGIGAAGLAVGAATGAKALAAKYRTTTGGHAAAVARRDEFKREMDKAFKGYKPPKRKETYVTLDLRSKKRRAAAGVTGGRITVSHKRPKGYRR
jgi:hypothetical protein